MGLFDETRTSQLREVRDPRGATLQQTRVGRGQPQAATWNSESAVRSAYLANSHVFACLQVLAKAVSGATLRSGSERGKVSGSRTQGPLYTLLKHPNASVTFRRLIAHTVIQRHVTGKWGWEYDLADNGKPVGLYPLIASRLSPIPSEGGTSYFDGFQYETAAGGRNNRVKFKPNEILYAWIPGALDFREPESPLVASRLSIDVVTMWEKFQYSFLRNDARPSIAVQTPEFADRDEYERFKHSYLAEHSGSDNAGKALFVELDSDDPNGASSIKIVPIGTPQKDAQSVEIYRESIKAVCVGLGVPYSMLDASGRTFNNGGIEVQNFYQGPVHDVAEDLADEINNQLAPLLGGDEIWFDYGHIPALRPPQKFQSVSPVELRDAEIIDDEEVREDLGLAQRNDPSDDATRAPRKAKLADQALAVRELIAAGFDPAGALAVVGLPAIALAAKPDPPAEPPVPPTAPVELPEPNEPAVPTRSTERETRATKRSELRAAAVRSADMHTRALEPTWTNSLTELFAKQKTATLSRLEGKRGRRVAETRDDSSDGPSADDIFDPTYWRNATSGSVNGLYGAVFGLGASAISDQTGISFDTASPLAQGFIDARTNQLAGQITDDTYQAIKDALNEGVTAGDDMAGLTDRVGAVFDDSPARAATIARTETISGYNAAKDFTATQMPDDVLSHKGWVATEDGRTRAAHTAADGQVVPKDEPFKVGGENLQYPGDPGGSAENCVNCRCTQIFLSPADLSEDERSGAEVMGYREAVSAIRNTRRTV